MVLCLKQKDSYNALETVTLLVQSLLPTEVLWECGSCTAQAFLG